ncbi:MAG: ABC transporter permease, partial [Flavobacterium sp.]
MRSLFISIQSEFYKSRKTLAFWAAILLPVIICGLIALGFYANSDDVLKQKWPPVMLWIRLASASMGVMGMLILPFYVIFMAFSVNNIEHKNDTWKTLFAQPLNKFSIYAAKYLYGVILIAISLILFPLLTYLSGFLLDLLVTGFKFGEVSPAAMLRAFYIKLFFASIGIYSIQFMLSLLWSDFLKPMGVGFVGTI